MLSNLRKTCSEDRRSKKKKPGCVVAWDSSVGATWETTARIWEKFVTCVLREGAL